MYDYLHPDTRKALRSDDPVWMDTYAEEYDRCRSKGYSPLESIRVAETKADAAYDATYEVGQR